MPQGSCLVFLAAIYGMHWCFVPLLTLALLDFMKPALCIGTVKAAGRVCRSALDLRIALNRQNGVKTKKFGRQNRIKTKKLGDISEFG